MAARDMSGPYDPSATAASRRWAASAAFNCCSHCSIVLPCRVWAQQALRDGCRQHDGQADPKTVGDDGVYPAHGWPSAPDQV